MDVDREAWKVCSQHEEQADCEGYLYLFTKGCREQVSGHVERFYQAGPVSSINLILDHLSFPSFSSKGAMQEMEPVCLPAGAWEGSCRVGKQQLNPRLSSNSPFAIFSCCFTKS